MKSLQDVYRRLGHLEDLTCCLPIWKDSFEDFPPEGESNRLYIARDTGLHYIWSDLYNVYISDIVFSEDFSALSVPGIPNILYVNTVTGDHKIWNDDLARYVPHYTQPLIVIRGTITNDGTDPPILNMLETSNFTIVPEYRDPGVYRLTLNPPTYLTTIDYNYRFYNVTNNIEDVIISMYSTSVDPIQFTIKTKNFLNQAVDGVLFETPFEILFYNP